MWDWCHNDFFGALEVHFNSYDLAYKALEVIKKPYQQANSPRELCLTQNDQLADNHIDRIGKWFPLNIFLRAMKLQK